MKDLKERHEDTDLRCPEAREVMDRIPSSIIRWGMTVMAMVAAGMLAAACLIRWPETAECPCTLAPTQRGDSCRVAIRLTGQLTRELAGKGSLEFAVTSPLLGESPSIRGTVKTGDITGFLDGTPVASVTVGVADATAMPAIGTDVLDANAVFVISHRRLIFHLFPLLQRGRVVARDGARTHEPCTSRASLPFDGEMSA